MSTWPLLRGAGVCVSVVGKQPEFTENLRMHNGRYLNFQRSEALVHKRNVARTLFNTSKMFCQDEEELKEDKETTFR